MCLLLINVKYVIGQKYILVDEVDSTNNYAARLIAEGKMAHGTVILAEKQTAGRGQRGNSWVASPGKHLTASFYAETAFLSATDFLYVNLAVALAVRAAVHCFSSMAPLIKWPNDLLVDDRKMGGLLIEAQWQGTRVLGVIIGIGINLVPESEFPSSCCLSDFCETVPPTLIIAQEIAAQLEIQFQHLKNQSWKELQDNYHRFLWKLGETIEVQTASGELLTGCITGIDKQGNLCFRSGEEVRAFGFGEVRFTY